MIKKRSGQEQKDIKTVAGKILSYISKHPGVHFNDLQRALDLAFGTLQYHLNQMERKNKIIVLRKEYKTLYFPPAFRDPINQKIMIFLRQRIPRALILNLLEHSEKPGHELTQLLKITKSTLSYYTSRLEKLGILKIKVVGREKLYSVNRPERVAKLLSVYRKSFGDELVDRFVELWVRI